jgi:hypothetical protein
MRYLSFAVVRRENGLFDLGDLALPLLLEAGEKVLELPRLLDLPALFSDLSMRLKRLVLILGISSKVTMMMFFGST